MTTPTQPFQTPDIDCSRTVQASRDFIRSIARGLHLMCALSSAVALLGTAIPASAQAPSKPKPKISAKAKKDKKSCAAVLAETRRAIATAPLKADQTVVKMMGENRKCACEIAKVALIALPRINGEPDAHMLGSMTKAILELIYSDIPECRGEINAIVLTALEVLKGDERALAIVLAAALPVLYANEPALIDSLFRDIVALYPGTKGRLAQLRAELLTPLADNRRPDTSTVEPNLVRAPIVDQPEQPDSPPVFQPTPRPPRPNVQQPGVQPNPSPIVP